MTRSVVGCMMVLWFGLRDFLCGSPLLASSKKLILAAAFGLVSNAAYATPIYWNVFNIEGESSVGADIVTYVSLMDMLTDSNRNSVNTLTGFGTNIVGSGAFVDAVAVPEPSTLGLLGAGLLGLAFARRREAA